MWVVHMENMSDRLAPPDGPKRLDGGQVARVVEALKMLQPRAAEIYVRPEPAAAS